MAVIEPLRQDVQNPEHIKKNSHHLRLWHWLNAIIISGSLITVLINSTLLDRDAARGLAPNPAAANNPGQLTAAGKIVHTLSDNVWQVHIYIGIALAVMLLYRLIFELFQPRSQHFFVRLREAVYRYKHNPNEKRIARHETVVRSIYLIFYLLLIIMVITGLSLAFKSDLGISKPVSHQIREVHGFCMYPIIAFIAVHLIGVWMAERKDSPGIVSDMINGGKSQNLKE